MGRRDQRVDFMEERKLSNALLGLPSLTSWWGSPLARGEYLLIFILPQPSGSQADGVEL